VTRKGVRKCNAILTRIRLKSLNAQTNIANLATEVIEKCKLINSSRYTEVEQLLYYLQKREMNTKSNTSGNLILIDMTDRNWLKKQLNEIKGDNEAEVPDGSDIQVSKEPISYMSQIDTYIEGLYEDVKDKIISTRAILQLAKVPENMQELVTNGTKY
jgi:hypothetical protein